MDPLTQTFNALADPTRRAILRRLASGDATVSELARPFDISGPSISRHLRVLEEAELIDRRIEARWRVCSLRRDRFDAARHWIDDVRRFWEEGFDKLEALLRARDEAVREPVAKPQSRNTPRSKSKTKPGRTP